jgi:hypothetical protein
MISGFCREISQLPLEFAAEMILTLKLEGSVG